jgi:hypothetical protein
MDLGDSLFSTYAKQKAADSSGLLFVLQPPEVLALAHSLKT